MQKFIQITVYGVLMMALPLLLATPSQAAKTAKKTPLKTKAVTHQIAKPVKKPTVAPKIAAKPVMTKKPVVANKTAVAPKKMDLTNMPTKAVATPIVQNIQRNTEVAERRTRIDFEDLLIQGQLKKADTVYLFERGENQLRSLVKKKENFREEIYQNYLN